MRDQALARKILLSRGLCSSLWSLACTPAHLPHFYFLSLCCQCHLKCGVIIQRSSIALCVLASTSGMLASSGDNVVMSWVADHLYDSPTICKSTWQVYDKITRLQYIKTFHAKYSFIAKVTLALGFVIQFNFIHLVLNFLLPLHCFIHIHCARHRMAYGLVLCLQIKARIGLSMLINSHL